MPQYTFPWKNKDELFADYRRQSVKTPEDFDKTTPVSFGILSVNHGPLDADEDYDLYMKNKDNLSNYFKYAIARVVAELNEHNARQGLAPSHVTEFKRALHLVSEYHLNGIIPLPLEKESNDNQDKRRQVGDVCFEHVRAFAAELDARFRIKDKDKKPESETSFSPFFKNFALNLTGIGIFAFAWSCFKKWTTGQYAFFDDQLITDKLTEMTQSPSVLTMTAWHIKDFGVDALRKEIDDIQRAAPPAPTAPFSGPFPLTQGQSASTAMNNNNDADHANRPGPGQG